MDWRQELNNFEGAYASVIPEKSPVGPSSKLTTSLKIPGAQHHMSGMSYKKWSDQGIQQFPPRVQIRILDPISIPFFSNLAPILDLATSVNLNKELSFLESYVSSIYQRAVLNRNNSIDIASAIEGGPVYCEEGDEETINSMITLVANYEADRCQLTGMYCCIYLALISPNCRVVFFLQMKLILF